MLVILNCELTFASPPFLAVEGAAWLSVPVPGFLGMVVLPIPLGPCHCPAYGTSQKGTKPVNPFQSIFLWDLTLFHKHLHKSLTLTHIHPYDVRMPVSFFTLLLVLWKFSSLLSVLVIINMEYYEYVNV